MITQNVNVFADKKGVTPVIHMVQGDSGRRLTCIFQDYDIPSGASASMSFERPDGNVYTTSATISNNNVSASITQTMLNVVGHAKATFHVTSSSSVVSNFAVDVEVEESAGFAVSPSSDDQNIYVIINGTEVRVPTEEDLEDLEGRLSESISDIYKNIYDTSDRLWDFEEDIYDIDYSNGTPIFKHISNTGALADNNNKNVSFDEPVKVLKWSTVYVDKGYKFQLGLFDLSGRFIKRVEWIYSGIYTFDSDYLVRIEISDENENPLTDFSILNHLHINLVYSKSNKVEKRLDEEVLLFNTQAKNIIKALNKDDIKRKTYTVASPNKYQAWSFVGTTNNKLYCFYNIGNAHEDNNGFDVYMKSSDDGIFWEDKKPVFTKENVRENITGMGNGVNGELLFWLRTGAPGSSDTIHELYSFDGNTFTKKSSPSFSVVCGHIGNIILNKGNNSLFSFFNTYGSSRTWGYLKSTDGGRNWTQVVIESNISPNECPTEMNGFYFSNGRYLVMGRKDTNSGTVAMFQIESTDGGSTWNKTYSNIDDVNGSTPSLILDGEDVYLYYWHRGAGDLRLRHEKFSDIFGQASAWSWSHFEIIATGARGQDAGNVSTCLYNDMQVATFYSGDSVNTGIYAILN